MVEKNIIIVIGIAFGLAVIEVQYNSVTTSAFILLLMGCYKCLW